MKCVLNTDCSEGETCVGTAKGYSVCTPKCFFDSECEVFGTDQKCIPTGKNYGLC